VKTPAGHFLSGCKVLLRLQKTKTETVMKYDDVAAIILAAGLGKRMKSTRAKVLHEVLQRPMILYVVDTARAVAGDHVIVVVGHQADRVRQVVRAHAATRFAQQDQQLGTGHAVGCALPQIPETCRQVIILCGDVPLISSQTIENLIADHRRHRRHLTVLAVEVDDPTGYGRILQDACGRVIGIVEEADATDEEKRLRVINTGIYCVDKAYLAVALGEIDSDNAQGELYLTDIVSVGYREKWNVGALPAADPAEFLGINSRRDLQEVEGILRRRQA
jgi:UDP-N-acetylglucosamine diphosphorylase/glucosamine-1-phosphate N-acetyltransferase